MKKEGRKEKREFPAVFFFFSQNTLPTYRNNLSQPPTLSFGNPEAIYCHPYLKEITRLSM